MKNLILAVALAIATLAMAHPASAKVLNKDINACTHETVALADNQVDGKQMTYASARHLKDGYNLDLPGSVGDFNLVHGQNPWLVCKAHIADYLAYKAGQPTMASLTAEVGDLKAQLAKANATIASQASTINGLNSDIDKWSAAYDGVKKDNKDLQSKNNTLQGAYDTSSSQAFWLFWLLMAALVVIAFLVAVRFLGARKEDGADKPMQQRPAPQPAPTPRPAPQQS